MVDISTKRKFYQQTHNQSLIQNLQTQTAVSDESYHEMPLKPNQNSELNSQRMMLPRKSSEQVLKTINNIKISVNSTAQQQHECLSASKDFGSLIVLSEGSEQNYRHQQKYLEINQYSIVGSQSGAYNSNMKSSSEQNQQLMSPISQNSLSNSSLKPGNDVLNIYSQQQKDQRSSINSYNKRVVELHLNQQNQNKDSQNKVATSTMKSQSIKHLSLDISELPGGSNPSQDIIQKSNEIKQDIMSQRQAIQNNNPLQQSQNSAFQSNEKIRTQVRIVPISTNISPKNQNAFGSPRYSINSVNNTITKSKMMIRKQQTANAISNSNNKSGLNQNMSKNENINITVDPSNMIQVNHSQNIQAFKHTSPQFSKFLNTQKNQSASQKKNHQDAIKANSKLIRNINCDTNQLRVCESHRDLHSGAQSANNKNKGFLDPQIMESSKENPSKFYSPSQMSLNKALSRISSVGELQKVKQQIASQRKSIQTTKQSQSKVTGLSSMLTANIIMSKAAKKGPEEILQSKSLEKYKQITFDKSQQQLLEEEEDEENEYMTNQEKLWSSIEQNQDINLIEDLLRRSDVKVSQRNIFDDGWTALHYAVHEGNFQVVKLLIEQYKALIDARSSTNKTPFHLACIRGDEFIIRYLLDHSASPHVVDRDGCTPLHYLCETENHEMVKVLLPICGASKDVRNRFGKKPADLIQDREFKKVLRNFSTRRESLNQRQNQIANSNTTNNNVQNSQSQTKSQSRERSCSGNRNVVQIHRLNDDKEVQDCIQQLFKKFSNYHRKASKEKQNQQQPQLNQKVTRKEESKNASTNQSQRNIVMSPQNSSLNTSIKRQQVNPQNRLTLGTQQSQKQLALNVPTSQKSLAKTSSKQKIMFPSTTQQNLINKNISPTKNIQLQVPSKITTTSLNTSQSQRTIGYKPALQNYKSSGKPEQKRLTSIQSVTNLIQEKTKQLDQQRDLSVSKDDDYNCLSSDTKNRKNAQIKNYNKELRLITETRMEDQGSVSQRTGDSSIINNDLHSNSIVNRNHKLTTFSLNQFSDGQENVTIEEKQKPQEEKIGPWSFIAHQLLGTGSFGEVFLVEKISNNRFYAMKVLTKSKIMGHNLTRYAMTERNVMSIVNHPFIVKLNYAFQTQEKLFLILDYCPGGDLAEYLQLEKRFNEDKVRLYSSEILLGLEELHRKDIIFRDLKPDNVVLDAEGHAMLTDFGLSKEGVMKEGMAKSFCGSYAYLAPEMLKKVGHGKAVDWYLLGVIIYEMLCGIPPYYANNKEELFENIKNAALDIPQYVSPVAKDIILRLLNRNPKKRLGTIAGADEIKKHPFFKNIDWVKLYNRQYKAPEPYLRKRFENFLQMSPEMQTNSDVYEQLRKQALFKGPIDAAQHIPGWSFPKSNASSMYKGSNKTFVFDMNGFQNKLAGSELRTPSTKTFQHQQLLREKNQQKRIIIQLKISPLKQSIDCQCPTLIIDRSMTGLIQELSIITAEAQCKSPSRHNHFDRIQKLGIKISRRSNVYDFRKNTLSSSLLTTEKKDVINRVQESSQMNKKDDQGTKKYRPLSPIKETENANISSIPPASRSIMDPDNQILFLDNGSRIKKERMNSNKRLKKKIVYVYESDSDEENGLQQKKTYDKQLAYSLVENNDITKIDRPNFSQNQNISSKRVLSIDGYLQRNQQSNQAKAIALPYINKNNSSSLNSKPPLPSSQFRAFQHQSKQNLSQARQIRTGGFQKLPIISPQIIKY
ncbi:protein kinase domain containing protein [Stylonychia lemnae]|uniref:Protein kinase domain containing protein n=1 Tax=Stylonychia lemnae TaxID=5949 RepID=A0A078B4Z4_STYLE|nr:protein kinase domain containing protein [Stylonychia lemnae]|eukprot:CDW89321.1 protein kinase domain containing protein [Stylonychia lemnae]